MSPGTDGGDITEALFTSLGGISPEPVSNGWQRWGERGNGVGLHKQTCLPLLVPPFPAPSHRQLALTVSLHS